MIKSDATVEFRYDHNGLRTQKMYEHNGDFEATNYTYHGKLLIHMNVCDDILHFFYDNEHNPSYTIFKGEFYRYIHNLHGDIVGILDNSGALVVEYKYDAWGKLLSTTGTLAETLGKRNPFRYRGYVYDEETELYYLGTRYYDSETCRFNQADSVACIGVTDRSFGNNLYLYCENNPVCRYDPNGAFSLGTFFKGVARAVTGAIAVAAGTLVCIAGAPVVTIVVAAVTITAGVLTVTNGAADIQQSVTGDNFVRDSVFGGSQEAYDCYSSITDTVAAIGTYQCGVYLRSNCVMQGAQPGTESKVRLERGQRLDRYGSEYGRYLTDPNTPADKLALTPNNTGVLNNYVVAKPFTVHTGIVAGCAWGPGGGTQYFTWISVRNLKRFGYIVDLVK